MCRELLVTLGYDPTQGALAGTPERWARWWVEFLTDQNGEKLETTFDSIMTDQLVLLRGIRVWSICEHHLLPFWCDISIGYLCKDTIVGISKLARMARLHAAGLQVQERLVDEIGKGVQAIAGVEDVAVIAMGEHLCMQMRGVRSGATMISSFLHGQFFHNPALRSEFMSLVGVK